MDSLLVLGQNSLDFQIKILFRGWNLTCSPVSFSVIPLVDL
jgi:hypothetical protein